jgi:hypothetical protein
MSETKRKPIYRSDLAVQMIRLENELLRAGLYCTMHKLNEAKRMLGYEMAGTPELFRKMEISRRRRVT